MKKEIIIFDEAGIVSGFTVKPGYAGLTEEGKVIALTSGWANSDCLFVYRFINGKWEGNWEDGASFPVEDVLASIGAWQNEQEIEKALEYSKGKKLKISEEDIIFTDIYPGERRNNGGEYGFYTRYCPIPGYPGIYKVFTTCTCDFDKCGCGYEGIKALTVSEYRKLRKKSNEIEKAGSLY